jgi:hypothetical protein
LSFLNLSDTLFHASGFGPELLEIILHLVDDLFLADKAPLEAAAVMPPTAAIAAAITITAMMQSDSDRIAVVTRAFPLCMPHPMPFVMTVLPATTFSLLIHPISPSYDND